MQTARQRNRRFVLRWLLLFWGPLALVCASVIGFKLLLVRAARVEEARSDALDRLGGQIQSHFELFIGSAERDVLLAAQRGQKLELSHADKQAAKVWYWDFPRKTDKVYRLSDPRTADLFYLHFKKDKLEFVGWEVRRTRPMAIWYNLWISVGNELGGVVSVGILFWVMLLVTSLAVWRFHRWVAQMLLAVALLTTLAWMLSAKYQQVFEDKLLQIHGLRWAAAMVAVSLLVLVLPNLRQRRAGALKCAQCHYNLTGNVSGICPECGTPIPEFAHRELAQLLATVEPEAETDEPPSEVEDVPDDAPEASEAIERVTV